MKMLTVILAALFTLASTGQVFAFDSAHESNAQVYFAIPFGGASKAEAMPRFGFSLDYGKPVSDNLDSHALQRISKFDFRLNIAGDASLYSNGVNLGERLNALYASDDDLMDSWLVPLGVIGVGIVGFAVAKGAN